MNVTWEDAPQPEGVCSRCAADLAERRCNLPGCTAAAVVCAMARGQLAWACKRHGGSMTARLIESVGAAA
jgi:hypothetical protein